MRSSTIISVLTVTVFSTGTLGLDPCFIENEHVGVGIVDYDPSTDLCCGGQVIPKNGIEKDCCAGNIPFDINLEICCGGKIYSAFRNDGHNLGCCGNHTYVTDGSSYCCGETNLYPSTEDEEGCCGIKQRRRDEMCCYDIYGNTSVHRQLPNHGCCGVIYYNKLTNDCAAENLLIDKGFGICGAEKYNKARMSCCQGMINNGSMDENDDCCGTHKYNTIKEQCCETDDSLVIPANRICCGSGSISKDQRCCMGNALNVTSSTQDCCGVNLYDEANGEDCCMPGGQKYNKSTKRCCDSGVVVDKDEGCCGQYSYNSETSVCCNDNYVIKKRNASHDSCCSSRNTQDGLSYDSLSNRCSWIEGSTSPVLQKLVTLCGTNTYNKDTDLCCNSNLYPNAVLMGMRCCLPGKYAFEPTKQICCNSIVYNRKDRPSCNSPYEVGREDTYDESYIDGGEPGDDNEILDDVEDEDFDESADICDICTHDEFQVLRDLKAGKIDVCHNTAQKFRIRKEKQLQLNKYKLLGKTMRNIYTGIQREKSQHIYMPCSCQIYHKQLIVVTDKPARKRKLVLDDNDIVLPYSRVIRNQVKKIHRQKCQAKTAVKELVNDLKVYLLQIQVKVNKLEKKINKKS